MLLSALIVASCLSTAIQALALPTPVDTEVTATRDVDTVTPDLFPFGYVDRTKRTDEQELDEDAGATPDMFPFGYIDKKAKRVIAAPRNTDFPFGYVDKRVVAAPLNTDFPFGYVDRRIKREVLAPEATPEPEKARFSLRYAEKKAIRDVAAAEATPKSEAAKPFPFGYADKKAKRID